SLLKDQALRSQSTYPEESSRKKGFLQLFSFFNRKLSGSFKNEMAGTIGAFTGRTTECSSRLRREQP
ncbi:MAG TPA: hypothetical protein PKJ58_11590, partial [Prolixibacteraceae bacterium]|nr:hypothetical protein [Prolixibacteraceae bacterium]